MTEIEPQDTDRIDRLLWKYVGVKPIREIAEALGIPVEQAMRRRKELSEEVDVLSVTEKQQKILVDLENVANTIRMRLDTVGDERNFAGIANSFISAMKTVNVELRAMEKKNTEAINALNDIRKREIVNMYVATVNKSVEELAETHGIDAAELFEVFNRNLADAAKELDER